MSKRKYDQAYQKLVDDGVSVWLHPMVKPYASKIYQAMLDHYVEHEEYEKCQFLFKMKEKFDKSILLSKIFQKLP